LQVLNRDKLSRGTSHVDLEGKRLYAWDRASREVGTGSTVIEASVRTIPWTCKVNYVHLRGVRFRYAANRAQEGAVQVLGNHCLIEDCVVERVNALGAVFGGKGNTVRRCVFQDNGWDGFDAGDLDHAPQDTALQRVVVLHLQAGRGWRSGGCIVFPEDLPAWQ